MFQASPKSFDKNNTVLLQVGSHRNKNIERVAEAIAGLSCRLEIVGKLSKCQVEALENFSIEYRASWGLSDREIMEKYRQCDMLIFASTYEGFGMPIIEANAIGRPVVTSNICSMPEVADGAACRKYKTDENARLE